MDARNLTKKAGKAVISGALNTATTTGYYSACGFLFKQPKMPKEIEKFVKAD